jgi:hypothetical protein
MELHKEQIDALFHFTAKKYVHWYDLQVELVDHLASRIEEEMDAAPALPFEKALEKVYKGFGIFGFANIVKEKQSQLERHSRKLWWAAFRSYFGWPKILLLVGITGLLWKLSGLMTGYLPSVLIFAAYIASELQLWYFRKKQKTPTKPLLLLQVSPLQYSSVFFFFYVIVGFDRFTGTAAFLLGLFIMLCILINLASCKAHSQVQASAEAQYPDAFAAA